MRLRFQVKELVYNYVQDSLCAGSQIIDYNNVEISIYIDDEIIASSTDLSGGLSHPVLPITTAANNIVISDVQIESVNVLYFQIDLPTIVDKTKLRVVINKSGFRTLDRTAIIYGYDLGINSNVSITQDNQEVCFILVPINRGISVATRTVFYGINETIVLTATTPGTIGNLITLTPDGTSTFAQLANDWNTNNPNNTVIATSPDAGLSAIPPINFGSVSPTGGQDEIINDKTYASFHGWRVPYRNDLFLYQNNSALYHNIEYHNTVGLASSFRDAIICCSKETMYKQITTLNDSTVHCPVASIVDSCETDFQDFPIYNYIPNLDYHITCDTNCCQTNDCVIIGNNNVIKPLADFNIVNLVNVNDVQILPFTELEMVFEVLSCTGDTVDSGNLIIPIPGTPPVDLSNYEIPFNPPERGDYLVKITYKVNGVFECLFVKEVKVCNQYEISKIDCNKYKASIYKIPTGSEILKISKLNDNKVFEPYVDFEINYCESVDIVFDEDGIYNFEFNGTSTFNMIVVVDCFWKACALSKIKNLACTDKAQCTCNGYCNQSCRSVPEDLYDFNAFMALSYAYVSLLNLEYFNNYIYDILTPNKIDELFTISQFLNRAKEYCEECNFKFPLANDCGCHGNTPSVKSNDCGCK